MKEMGNSIFCLRNKRGEDIQQKRFGGEGWGENFGHDVGAPSSVGTVMERGKYDMKAVTPIKL